MSTSERNLKSVENTYKQLYKRLLDIDVERNIGKRTIAFWLWLQDRGYSNIVHKLTGCSPSDLRLLTEESELCVLYYRRNGRGDQPNIPFLTALLKRNINLNDRVGTGYAEIEKLEKDVCDKILDDAQVTQPAARPHGLMSRRSSTGCIPSVPDGVGCSLSSGRMAGPANGLLTHRLSREALEMKFLDEKFGNGSWTSTNNNNVTETLPDAPPRSRSISNIFAYRGYKRGWRDN